MRIGHGERVVEVGRELDEGEHEGEEKERGEFEGGPTHFLAVEAL